MLPTNLSAHQLKVFHRDGYIIIKNFCGDEEVSKLYHTAVEEHNNRGNSSNLNSRRNKKASLPLWFTPGNDVFGYLQRSEKIVNSIARLLETDSPVCHIHSKLMEKTPYSGGVWEWHQDYAYWHTNKFLSADQMVSVMVALTDINMDNGGSQLIRGSHKLGRLPHHFEGEKVGADMEMVNTALETMELVYPELEAGDALFFHSNLLHRSEANFSEEATWSNISCYSSQSNLAHKQIFTSWHTPVSVVPNESILRGDVQMLPEKAILYKKVDAFKNTVWGQLVAIS